MEQNGECVPLKGRIMSIDALRGFDMFWIAGGKEVVVAFLMLFMTALPPWLDYHFEHVAWEGFCAWDMIMPLFLFISGASMPFSFSRRTVEGQGKKALYMKVARRILILWVLGMIAQGNLLEAIWNLDCSDLQLYSNTLQSIAAGYLVASITLLNLPVLGQFLLLVAVLVIYWLLMALVPFGGHPAGTIEPTANLALYVDQAILRGFREANPHYTYTWILSSLGFAGSVLLGVMSGHLLKSELTPKRKLIGLISAGIICLALGAIWGNWFPIIKHIWTSSMVLWAAGWSFLLLAFFFLVIDMLKFRAWAFGFVVIGMNAIVAYMGQPIGDIGEYLFKWAPPMLGHYGDLLQSVAAFMALWVVLYVLYRKRLFVRI